MHEEYGWSILDPKPITIWVSEVDEYIVYWNGYVMPHSVAMTLALSHFGIYPTPQMKKELFNTHKRLYVCGVFGDNLGWDDFFSSDTKITNKPLTFLQKRLSSHIAQTIKGMLVTEVLGWFDLDHICK